MGALQGFCIAHRSSKCVKRLPSDGDFGFMALETCEPEGPPWQRMPYAPDDQPEAKIFISYSRKDMAFADRLDAALTRCELRMRRHQKMEVCDALPHRQHRPKDDSHDRHRHAERLCRRRREAAVGASARHGAKTRRDTQILSGEGHPRGLHGTCPSPRRLRYGPIRRSLFGG